ncbi:MAG: [Fe-Fe] hydrogenase large subunit C-terminal domain-containing protein, partial [Spirochaetales bacterium]|nr:[Fe-Fe] hydrogenase large subunit C-terminal domain-containing protein [Spirochaetales bacterium]
IVHNCVPCEDSCPVGAVKQNENGISEINSDKCIGCGRCLRSCPFGAIAKRSGLIPVGKMLHRGEKVVGMIAPAIEGQFEGSLEQIKKAMKAVGFTEVVEVAEGAKITAEREAKELMEKKEKGEGYLATSCCPAWFSLVDKHIPAIRDHISTTLSPMGYTAQLCKERFPGYKVVFIGPCVAKRYEAATKYPELIDRVLSYGELASIFVAKGVNVADMPKDYEDDDVCKAIDDCRDFAVSGGVAECVLSRVDDRSKYKVMSINGIDSKVVRQIKLWPKIQPDADLVEIMCCYGGCVAGPGTFNSVPNALKMREAQKKARHEAWEKKEQKEE